MDIKKSPSWSLQADQRIMWSVWNGHVCIALKKYITQHSLEVGISKITVQNILHKCLRLYAYNNIQLKHEIKQANHPKWVEFAMTSHYCPHTIGDD